MKQTFIFIQFLMFILISYRNGVRLGKEALKKNTEEDLISDKELDILLKDPKYAKMAGDLMGPGAVEALTAASAEKTPAAAPASSKGGHYMSPSYKEHLDRMKNGKSTDSGKSKKDDSLGSLDMLTKSLGSDPLKELDLLGGSGKIDEKQEKKNEAEDKFKAFDFISKQQARYLIEVLKQPVFFNMLPAEAQTIVKVDYYCIFIII
jgi:hypothetical protein